MIIQQEMFGDSDVSPPAQAHSETSREAAEAIKPKVNDLHRMVLDALRGATDGLTDEEMQELIPMKPSTQRPRRIELCKLGLVRDSGRTRKTRSCRKAVVWVESR
jgi:hypothetical protein